MQTIESQVLPPLLNPRTDTPPPPPPHTHTFFWGGGGLFKNLSRLKINILSSIYPEINFPAESVIKINNLSRPKVPAPPPPQGSNGRPLSSVYYYSYQICTYPNNYLKVLRVHRCTVGILDRLAIVCELV